MSVKAHFKSMELEMEQIKKPVGALLLLLLAVCASTLMIAVASFMTLTPEHTVRIKNVILKKESQNMITTTPKAEIGKISHNQNQIFDF